MGAVDRLRELSGSHFDPKVVDALLAVLEDERADAAAGTPRPTRAQSSTPTGLG